MGSFNILRISSTLETLTDTDFQVLVKSKIALDYIKKKNRTLKMPGENHLAFNVLIIIYHFSHYLA